MALLPIFVSLLVLAGTTESAADSNGHAAALTIKGRPTDFDFLIGDWDLDIQFLKIPGKPPRAHAQRHVRREYDGRLLVDEVRTPDDSGKVHLTITYRVFDLKSSLWMSQSLNLDDGSWREGQAAGAGPEIHVRQWFRGPNGESGVYRSRYQDITPDSFVIRVDRSLDGGRTWEDDVQITHAHRVR